MTVSINVTQHNNAVTLCKVIMLSVAFLIYYAKCHYAEFVNVIMLNVIMLSVVTVSVS